MFWTLLLLATAGRAQNFCGKGQPSHLATVAVWVKHNGSLFIFRISDEDLTDEGFQRSPADRELYPVQLAREPGNCPVGLCAFRLSVSRRSKDGVLLQQEDILPLPDGYQSLNDDFYCGRSFGDCGADVPIYRLTRGKGPEALPAYSMDVSASIPGFTRDPRPLCFGWSDGTGLRRPVSGDGCFRHSSIANGEITYSVRETASFAVGTTAVLHCSSGFVSSGVAGSLCTRNGWNPPNFGSCLRSNLSSPLPRSVTFVSSGSASREVIPYCTAGAKVKNGQIFYSQLEIGGRLPTGTTASVLCYLGFISTSTATLKCENGDWTGQWPTCISAEKVQCQPLPIPSKAKISYESNENPLTIGSVATLQCPSGLAIAGAVRTTCGRNGWQPKVLGMCVTGLPCFPLGIFGGNVTYIQANPTTLYAAGTTALITCNIGYVLQGSGSSLCQSGQWSPNPGTCSLSSTGGIGSINSGSVGAACFDFMAPFSGTISYSLPSAGLGTHPSASVATLNCNLGSTVSGALSSTCSNGAWSPPSLGTCSTSNIGGNGILECANPIVTNGVISYSTSSPSEPAKPVGSSATLTCNFGFTPSGSITSTCQSGTWVPALGSCIEGAVGGTTKSQCIGGLLPPFGATVTYSNGASFGPYPSGSTATMTCSGGQIPTGAAFSTCLSGQWSPSSFGTCPTGTGTTSTCAAPAIPAGGTISYSQIANLGNYNQGTTATLMCTTGAVTGSTTSTCTGGTWSPPLGTCGGVGGAGTCLSIIPPMSTTISYSVGGPFGPFTQGTTATISCMDPSQQVIGSRTATCQNSQWTPSVAFTQCAPQGVSTSQCPSGPTTPFGATITYSNGAIFGPFQTNTVATMTCTSGFVQGQSTSICTNGQWSPALGTCSTSGGTGLSCSSGVTVPTGGSVTYSNGAIFGPYPAGTVATLTCGTTFPTGSSTATCSNGQWSQLGSCSGSTGGSSCPFAVSIPSGATVTYSNGAIFAPFASGTVATLQCISGTPVGQTTSTCSNGQWTSTLGTCSSSSGGSSCSPLSPTFGSTISYSINSSPFSYPSGTTATLTCTSGFITGPSKSICSNGIWEPSIGTCSTGGGGQQCLFAPATPPGASLSYSTGSTVGPWNQGTTVTLSCPLGQYPQGSSTAACSNGSWGQLATSCSSTSTTGGGGNSGTGISCSAQIAPINGNISYSQAGPWGPFPSGTSAFLNCNNGYRVDGTTSVQCSNGQWTPSQFGSCVSLGTSGGAQCSMGLTAISGTITYSNGQSFGPWNSGTIAQLTCIAPNFFSSGATTSTCSNGQWIPSQLGTCSTSGGVPATSCQAIPFISGGSVTYSNFGVPPYSEGTSATLVCNFGTVLSGQSTVVCRGGGWTPFPGLGTCQTALHSPARFSINSTENVDGCPSPKAPPNGEITYSAPEEDGLFSLGTTAALRCVDGFEKRGATFATCRNGAFRPLLGSCDGNETSPTGICLPLQAAVNGKISYIQASSTTSLEAGTTALLDCEDGYAISGRATLSCNENGSWQPEDGFGVCELAIR